MLIRISILLICALKLGFTKDHPPESLRDIEANLMNHSLSVNIDRVQSTLKGAHNQSKMTSNKLSSQAIPTQKSSYTIYVDWQKPSKCVEAISDALKPHYSWRLLQEGRDRAKYRVPSTEVKGAIQSIKNLVPVKIYENHVKVSQQFVYNASRYVAIDTLAQYYYQAIQDSEKASVISELSDALDQLELERNQVMRDYLTLRLHTQTSAFHIECKPFAPPVEGEARVAVPWINQIGIHQLEGNF